MLKQQLIKLAKYNVWANEKVVGFITNAGAEKMDKVVENSFPSIRKTIYHIWDAEVIWIKRLEQKAIPEWPPHSSFTGDWREFNVRFIDNSKALLLYVETFHEDALTADFTYQNSEGVTFTNRICDILNHVLNHSTYHRGQLITMLRTVDFTAVSSTDYITYCREN